MSDWVRSIADSEEARSKAAEQAARKREWVTGGEHTAAELADMHRQLRADFYARNPETAA